MTKADIVSEIAKSTGVEKVQVQAIVEAFMDSIKTSLTNKISAVVVPKPFRRLQPEKKQPTEPRGCPLSSAGF